MKRGILLVLLAFIFSIYSVDAVLVWKEDFEDQGYLDTFFTQTSDTSCSGNGYSALSTTNFESQNGDYSLRFDACSVATDSVTGLTGCYDIDLYFGDPTSGITLGNTHDLMAPIESSDEIYVKYWVKYDTTAVLSEQYLVVDWFRFPENGYVAFDQNSPSINPLSALTYETFVLNDYNNPLPAVDIYDGLWHKVEFYVNYDYNGAGNANITGWIDDSLALDWQGPLINGRPDYIRLHRFLQGSSSCTSFPVQFDDLEIWNEIPNLSPCPNGEVLSMCECGGSTRDYGYCCDNSWQTTECLIPQDPCVIDSAEWSATEVDMGTQVNLIVNGTNCEGEQLNFQMLEHDSFIGDYDDVTSLLINPPATATFSGGTAVVSWTTEWIEDQGFSIDSNPEYIFNASLVSNSSQYIMSDELKVNYIITSCSNGQIVVPCECDGVEYEIGDGYCCAGTFSVDPCPTTEVIIDNGDAGTSQSGSWSESTYWPGYYGTNYMYSLPETTPGLWYQWSTTLSAGTYEVYAWWTNASDRPYDVNYTITGTSTSDVININQRINGNQWNLLGSFDFDGASSVRVITGSTGAGGTCADAIRFYKVDAPSDLLLYLPFDEDMLDYSGNGYDGVCTNCPDSIGGYDGIGSAYEFNGIDDLITVPDNNDLDLSGTDYSIAYWVKINNYPAGWNIISKEHYTTDTNNAGYVFDGYGNDLYFYPNSNSDAGTNAVLTNINSNDWMHIAVTYDSITPELKYYIDGILVDSNSVSISPAPHTNDLHIGASTGLDRYFSGSIDELRIYGRVLNDTEIQNLSYLAGPECLIDADCDYLDGDYCDGTQLMHSEGVCNVSSMCEISSTLIEDCFWRTYTNTTRQCNVVTGDIEQYGSEWGCSINSCADLGTPYFLNVYQDCNDNCGAAGGYIADQDLCYDISQTTCPQTNYVPISCNGDILVEYSCSGTDATEVPTDCNTLDGWQSVTGPDNWIPYGECTELKQVQENYYDYFCNEGTITECTYGAGANESRWINTTETRNLADDTSCDDGLSCTNNDVCTSGVCGGSQVDCSANDLIEIASCLNNPDGIDWTWDYRTAFTSVCQEPSGSCTTGDAVVTSDCDITNCGAECELNTDCAPTDCDAQDGCVGNDYYDYDNVDNNCLSDCSCESNSCGTPTITTNSPLCVACTVDEDCSDLNLDFCFGTEVRQTNGVCNAGFECEAQTIILEDCADQNNNYCSDDNVVTDIYTCSSAACGLDQTIVDQECDDGLFCNGDETCSAATCQSGTAPVIDDGISCTADSCDETNDIVINNPDDSLCDDGDIDTVDTCNTISGCIFTPLIFETNQTINLIQGMNTINVLINTTSTSEDLNSIFVLAYDGDEWVVDWSSISGDEFNLEPLSAYYAYSGSNTEAVINGQTLSESYKKSLTVGEWNLFSVQNSELFNTIYPEFVGNNYGIYEIDSNAGQLTLTEIQETDLVNSNNAYWINLAGPEFGPPMASTNLFETLINALRNLFIPQA